MKILIIERNPMIIEGYMAILGPEEHTFLKTANCEDFATLFTTLHDLDLALITYETPSFSDKKLETRLDCATWIKRNIPYCKVILLTENEKALALYEMYKTAKADALLMKSDFTKKVFFDLVVTHTDSSLPYLSLGVKKAIENTVKNTTLLDSKNRRIITLLSNGYRLNQLDKELLLSTSAIQKRVSKLLVAFHAKNYQELLVLLRKREII